MRAAAWEKSPPDSYHAKKKCGLPPTITIIKLYKKFNYTRVHPFASLLNIHFHVILEAAMYTLNTTKLQVYTGLHVFAGAT